ncbi:MAG: LysR family transcriptional regulator [Pseudomonadota bacterium]
MRLDTESLRTLKATIESGSLTAAAARLSITSSAVSWKLKRLEQRLGRKLIVRLGHQIQPTSEAKKLLEYADVIVAVHDRAVQHFRLSDVAGKLIIGITDDLASNQLPTFVHDFHLRHPGIRLEIKVEQQLALLEWYEERVIDLAILPMEKSLLEDSDIHLWEEELIWVKSRERDYALSDTVPLVTFSPKCTYREAAIECLEANGVDYYISMESPSLAGVRGIVSSGMGVTLINRGLVTSDQCEWEEARAFGPPRVVKFAVRATPMIPSHLRELVIQEIESFYTSNGAPWSTAAAQG